jgi:nucleotide-binding universal stress UspA family protein
MHQTMEDLMHYKSLLVAVDHSEITERVLGAARDLASLSDGEVWVLHLRTGSIAPGRADGEGVAR